VITKGEQRVDLVRRTIELAFENVENIGAFVRGRQTVSLFRLLWT